MSTELSFPCKRITFGDRDVPVLMQNENGPCPLLALANVLLLRGNITIHVDISRITFRDLTSLIAEYMLDRNRLSESNFELRTPATRSHAPRKRTCHERCSARPPLAQAPTSSRT